MKAQDVLKIENLKCGGCQATIKKALTSMDGVENVRIDTDKSEVSVIHTEGVSRMQIAESLRHLGYPEVGTMAGLAALGAKAKSYVSCAIGRMAGE